MRGMKTVVIPRVDPQTIKPEDVQLRYKIEVTEYVHPDDGRARKVVSCVVTLGGIEQMAENDIRMKILLDQIKRLEKIGLKHF